MRNAAWALCFSLSAFFCDAAQSDQFSLQRGYSNYMRLLNGEIRYETLSEIERQEVTTVVRALSSSAPEGASEDCKEAYDDAEDASEELASSAGRLKVCAENKDLDGDDCSSEMRRTRSAHSEYESAVNDVRSECD